MNPAPKPDSFEQALRRLPRRQIPPEWRAEILSAARQAQRPTLDAPRSTALSALRQLLWPSPVAWAGLAAIWLCILGLNLTVRQAIAPGSLISSGAAPEIFLAWKEQARLLTELVGPPEPLVAERPKPAAPRPRSERQDGFRTV